MSTQSLIKIDQLHKEQDMVKTQTKEIDSALSTVHVLSLPSELTLNNFNADVKLN